MPAPNDPELIASHEAGYAVMARNKEAAMKIGVFEFVTDQSVDPAVLAKRAEELGFASFWVPEHGIIPIH